MTAVQPQARLASYVRAAIDSELTLLRNTRSSRACAAYKAAAALGGFVAAGALAHSEAEDYLLDAAAATGLPLGEAQGQIRRGLYAGQKTPRTLPEAGSYRPPTSQLVRLPGYRREPPKYPPRHEIEDLWSACHPVSSAAEAVAWFCYRYRYRDQYASLLERAEMWDLVRVIPPSLPLPSWARSRQGTWVQSGHRLLFRLWDATGSFTSVRARGLTPTATPKSLSPAGFQVKGVVLSDPLGVQLASGADLNWWTPVVLVLEGEPDWLVWAAQQREAEEQGPACFGLHAGSWGQDLGDRIPTNAEVIIRTDNDAAGDDYAEHVIRTLAGRCRLYRKFTTEEAS